MQQEYQDYSPTPPGSESQALTPHLHGLVGIKKDLEKKRHKEFINFPVFSQQ